MVRDYEPVTREAMLEAQRQEAIELYGVCDPDAYEGGACGCFRCRQSNEESSGRGDGGSSGVSEQVRRLRD